MTGPCTYGAVPTTSGRFPDFRGQLSPIAQNFLGADENVRIEIDHLLPQFAVEARHHRDDKNEDRDTERHTDDGNERDDRDEGALRFQIAKREE